jgi:hypothetical protein
VARQRAAHGGRFSAGAGVTWHGAREGRLERAGGAGAALRHCGSGRPAALRGWCEYVGAAYGVSEKGRGGAPAVTFIHTRVGVRARARVFLASAGGNAAVMAMTWHGQKKENIRVRSVVFLLCVLLLL